MSSIGDAIISQADMLPSFMEPIVYWKDSFTEETIKLQS